MRLSVWRDQEGQAALLVVGVSLICFAVAGLAVDGTRAWLARRSLQNLVDAAVLSGANQLDDDALYSGSHAGELDTDAARRAALRSLSSHPLVEEVSVVSAHDAVRAVVRAQMETTFLFLIGVRELQVGAEATASPVFGES